MAGCSSHQPVASDSEFEYEGFVFHSDSVICANGMIVTPHRPTDDPIDLTWSLLQFLSNDTIESDTGERIAALRREMRNGVIARDYFWPMKDRSARWIIEAYHTCRTCGDRQWLRTVFEAGAAALDAQWDINFMSGTGLLRGETVIPGINEPTYPQWMRAADKLGTMHLSTNVLAITALRAVAALADSLDLPSERFSKRADTLARSINRHMWEPQTGTYARCLYSPPYAIACNTPDIPSLLLAVTADAADPNAALYMLTQLSRNGTGLMKPVPQSPSIKWISEVTACSGNNDCMLSVYDNGICEQATSGNTPHIDIPYRPGFHMINIVPASSSGTTGYSTQPHKIIPKNTITEIEAESAGVPGTSLIRQISMARRFIELTPAKNSQIRIMLTEPEGGRYLMELIYADGTSYQPWQLRSVTVNGRTAGMIAMPKLYTGPSTRGISTPLVTELAEGTNLIVIDTTSLLPPRGSILLDKIRFTRLD